MPHQIIHVRMGLVVRILFRPSILRCVYDEDEYTRDNDEQSRSRVQDRRALNIYYVERTLY